MKKDKLIFLVKRLSSSTLETTASFSDGACSSKLFNKFIIVNLLIYLILSFLVLTSYTNDSTLLGSTLSYSPKLFLIGTDNRTNLVRFLYNLSKFQ